MPGCLYCMWKNAISWVLSRPEESKNKEMVAPAHTISTPGRGKFDHHCPSSSSLPPPSSISKKWYWGSSSDPAFPASNTPNSHYERGMTVVSHFVCGISGCPVGAGDSGELAPWGLAQGQAWPLLQLRSSIATCAAMIKSGKSQWEKRERREGRRERNVD